jgi:hypothetical protein
VWAEAISDIADGIASLHPAKTMPDSARNDDAASRKEIPIEVTETGYHRMKTTTLTHSKGGKVR